METRKVVKLCALSLSIILLGSQMAYAQRIYSSLQQQSYVPQAVLQELAQAKVIYLGETHNRIADHDAQLQIIEALHQRNPRIAIAMEMFQRPFQPYLDRYLAGTLTEPELRQKTDYEDRWGYPWENYAPMLRFAKANRLPVVALSAPTEVSRKVARRGLESLSQREQRYIPPFSDIRTDNTAYRELMRQVYESHQHKGNSSNFERFFQSQVLWDETMAETIVQFLQANPDFQVVVLTGKGHVIYGHGIPSRVARRLEGIVQRTILLNPSQDTQTWADKPADFLWESTPAE